MFRCGCVRIKTEFDIREVCRICAIDPTRYFIGCGRGYTIDMIGKVQRYGLVGCVRCPCPNKFQTLCPLLDVAIVRVVGDGEVSRPIACGSLKVIDYLSLGYSHNRSVLDINIVKINNITSCNSLKIHI